MTSSSYPQSWTLTPRGDELRRAGHTIFRRGDGDHHWPAVCSKCNGLSEIGVSGVSEVAAKANLSRMISTPR